LTKPFSPRELVARIKAASRRLQSSQMDLQKTVLEFDHVCIDLGSREVWADGQLVELTSTEFNVLQVLAQHPRIVLSREQIIERVWGNNFYGEARVVDVHVGHIRQKLGRPGLIQTVRGIGYRFEDERR
jgi:two-component system, OmpR family, alkaline phosphatase synthesis response regulator PhoP